MPCIVQRGEYLWNCKGEVHAKHASEYKDQCSKDTYGFKEVQKGTVSTIKLPPPASYQSCAI